VILGADIVAQLARQCAPQAAPQTLLAIAKVESGLDPLAIGVNGSAARRLHPVSATEAVTQARALLAGGGNIDLGLTQINSANLHRLGLGLAEAFDPCRSLAASATLLREDYRAARGPGGDPQTAVRAALSLYNTGDPGSITTIHADSATLAFEQLTLLVKESEGGRDLARDDIHGLLRSLVDVVVQMRREQGRFRVTEVWYDPVRKRALAA
jgi:hypothetical protein